jgi:hypothetical protein
MNNNDAQSYTEARRKILDTISLMVHKLQYPPINNTFGHYNRATDSFTNTTSASYNSNSYAKGEDFASLLALLKSEHRYKAAQELSKISIGDFYDELIWPEAQCLLEFCLSEADENLVNFALHVYSKSFALASRNMLCSIFCSFTKALIKEQNDTKILTLEGDETAHNLKKKKVNYC